MGRTIDDSSEEADLTAELSADLEGYLRNHAQEVGSFISLFKDNASQATRVFPLDDCYLNKVAPEECVLACR